MDVVVDEKHLQETGEVNFIPLKDEIENRNKDYIKKLKGGILWKGLKLENYMDNIQHFYETQPFFYDKNEIFWFWDIKNDRWNIVDEIDLMNLLDRNLEFYGQTVGKGVKNNYIEAFKRVGRLKSPEDAPKKWIQFKDKAFSLRSKKVHTVTPKYFFTNPIPWEIGNSDSTPTMDKLFKEWVGEEYVQALYEIIAYCCYRDYPIQTLICLFGGGRNGKTTFLKLLNRFIGIDNICSTELDILLESRFESFKMYKKLVCEMGETNFGVLEKSSILKKLVGSDLIGYEVKGKTPFSDYNYSKMIIASNSLPSSNDTSDGFFRRWFIIDFPNEFPEGKDILISIPDEEYRNLAKKVTNILPEILSCGKFSMQGTINERKHKYQMASNPLPIFINQYCQKGNIDTFVSYGEVYTRYIQFLFENKRRKVKKKEFVSALEDEGFWIERTTKTIGKDEQGYNINKNDTFIIGLSWKSTENVKYAENLYSPLYTRNESKKPAFSTLNSSKEDPKEEFVKLYSFESWPRNLEYVRCTIEGCKQTPCKRDFYDVPYCKIHLEESGVLR